MRKEVIDKALDLACDEITMISSLAPGVKKERLLKEAEDLVGAGEDGIMLFRLAKFFGAGHHIEAFDQKALDQVTGHLFGRTIRTADDASLDSGWIPILTTGIEFAGPCVLIVAERVDT